MLEIVELFCLLMEANKWLLWVVIISLQMLTSIIALSKLVVKFTKQQLPNLCQTNQFRKVSINYKSLNSSLDQSEYCPEGFPYVGHLEIPKLSLNTEVGILMLWKPSLRYALIKYQSSMISLLSQVMVFSISLTMKMLDNVSGCHVTLLSKLAKTR